MCAQNKLQSMFTPDMKAITMTSHKPKQLLACITLSMAALTLAACAANGSNAATTKSPSATTASKMSGVDSAIAGTWRTADNRARDSFRHPSQTLTFFGVQPTQTVIEITPGAGWYSDILAPYLKDNGSYVAAIWDDAIAGQPDYRYSLNKKLREKFSGNAAVFGKPTVRAFDPSAPVFGSPGSADVVLTFRNAHNWYADGMLDSYFKAFNAVLKPGGTLGVVDHRAKPGTSAEVMKTSGYLTEDVVIAAAERAGFKLVEKSEINANPKDTADHPNGVWTLPPSNKHDQADAQKYRSIGESDRMTLRFTKP